MGKIKKNMLNREARISLQKLMLKLFKNIECTNHRTGDVTDDDNGNLYSNCLICDKRISLAKMTLGDVDKMECGEIDRLLPKGMTMDEFIMSANRRSGLTK